MKSIADHRPGGTAERQLIALSTRRRTPRGHATAAIAGRPLVDAAGSAVMPAVPLLAVPLLARMLLAALMLAAVGGCSSYQFGSRSLYRGDVRTVYVPVVRNQTFRHDLGPRLTEAVVRLIEMRTPYKVTGDPAADSTLQISITGETKSVLTESASDDPRALDAVLVAQVTWNDRQGTPLLQNHVILDDNLGTNLLQGSRFVPEAGQSLQTAMQDTIDDLADRIVSQMEMRW